MLKSFNALVSGTLVSTFKFNEAAIEMLAQLMTFEFDFAPLFEALCDKCATILYHVISLVLEREERNCQQFGIISNRINDKNRIKGINNSNTTRVMEPFFFSSIEQLYNKLRRQWGVFYDYIFLCKLLWLLALQFSETILKAYGFWNLF